MTLAGGVAACAHPPAPSSRRNPEEKLAAVEACMGALEAFRSGGDAGDLVKGCAALYMRPACRDAWSATTRQAPGEVEAACAHAYCDSLPAPAPKACSGDAAAHEPDNWPELDAAILAYDLDLDREAAARMSLVRMARIVVERGGDTGRPAAPVHKPITLSLAADAHGTTIAAAGKTWQVGAPPTAAELAPILQAIKTEQPDADEVVLEADAGVAHASVVAVLEACKQAGFVRFAIATQSQ